MRTRRTPHGRTAAIVSALSLVPMIAGAPTRVESGPWTLDRGGYYARAELAWLSSDSQFDALGEEVEEPFGGKFQDRTLQFAAEYGVRDRLTLDLGLPLRFLSREDDLGADDTNQGFGDARFGLRYRALRSPAVVSVQVDGQVPTGYNIDGFGRPPLGRGQSSVTPRLLAGYTLSPKPAYAQAELGRQFALSDQLADHWVAAAQAGFWPTAKLLVLGEWQWQEHADDEKPFEDVFRIGGQARYRFHGDFEALAGLRHILGGQFTRAGTALVLGITYKGNALPAYHGATAGGNLEGTEPPPPPPTSPAPVPPPTTPAPADTSGS